MTLARRAIVGWSPHPMTSWRLDFVTSQPFFRNAFATLLQPAMSARLPEMLDTPEAQGGGHPGAGNVSVKVVPCPSTLSTVTRPSWATRISCTIYRPKPVPPGLVV
jgi:hypothetical protein